MFGIFTITKWQDSRDSSNRISAQERTTGRQFILNTDRIDDLLVRGNGSKFRFFDNPYDTRENSSYIESTATVTEIENLMDSTYFTNSITLPIYINNDITRNTVNTTILCNLFSYADAYNPDPTHASWVCYVKDGFKRVEVLVALSLTEIYELIYGWESYWATRIITGVSIVVDSDTQFTVSWINNGIIDYTGHKLYISTDDVTYNLYKTVAFIGTSTVLTGLTGSTIYYVKVAPYKIMNIGTLSIADSDITYATPIYAQTGGVNNTVAWFRPNDTGGSVKDESNRQSIWWDMMVGSSTLGVEQSSGAIIQFGVYLITACQANFFYTGCLVGDTFVCLTVKTCDANNKVKLYTGHHATQPIDNTYMPVNELFDGINDYMATIPFTFNQPEFLFMVLTQISWTVGDKFFDGRLANNYWMQTSSSPQITVTAGTASGLINNALVGKKVILKVLINGANSKAIVDEYTPVTGDFGANVLGGLMFGARQNGTNPSNIKIDEFIANNQSLNAADERLIHTYLKKKHFMTFNKPYILFTCDGFTDNISTGMYDALKDKGCVGTFYITSDEVGTPGDFTWAQLVTYHNDGFDIQCHSKTHPHEDTLTQAQLIAEMEGVNAAFIAGGLPVPEHHAYPFGDYDADVITWIAPYRKTCRTAKDSYTDYTLWEDQWKDLSKYELRGSNIDYVDAAALVVLKAKMDIVAVSNSVMVLFTHGVGTGPSSISRNSFDALLDYAISKGIEPITISQLYELLT